MTLCLQNTYSNANTIIIYGWNERKTVTRFIVLTGQEIWRNDGGLGQSNEKE